MSFIKLTIYNSKNTMANTKKQCLGIDVSKKELVIFNPINSRTYKVKNNIDSISSFIEEIKDFSIEWMVCEATGSYSYLSCITFFQAGFKVSRINPKKIKNFSKAFGDLAKTDKLDAKLISLYGESMPITEDVFDSKEEDLRILANRRMQVVSNAIKTKNRKEGNSTNNKEYTKSIERELTFYKEEQQRIEDKIDYIINQSATLTRKREIISSIPNIGKTNANNIVSFIPELGKLNNKEIASLVGVAPKDKQRGESDAPRNIIGGRKKIRNNLYMSSMSCLANKKNYFYDAYSRITKQGKDPKVGMVAIIRKMVIIANSLVKKDQIFDHNYQWSC